MLKGKQNMNRRDLFKSFGAVAALPSVGSVKELKVQSADVIVVKCRFSPDEQTIMRIKDTLRHDCGIPQSIKILVLGPDVDIEVWRR